MRGKIADSKLIVMALGILSEQRPSNPKVSQGVWMSLNYIDIILTCMHYELLSLESNHGSRRRILGALHCNTEVCRDSLN
jgi:hypothetical protein